MLYRVVLYRLYRPETQYHNGKHVRDLSKLNRDMSQVGRGPRLWKAEFETACHRWGAGHACKSERTRNNYKKEMKRHLI